MQTRAATPAEQLAQAIQAVATAAANLVNQPSTSSGSEQPLDAQTVAAKILDRYGDDQTISDVELTG